MKRRSHFLPPRSSVLYGYTRRMLDESSTCVRKFAMRVAEQYMALIAPDQRSVPFRWGVTIDDLCKAERHNAQILSRLMDGTVKVLPADLEDAWVLALPEPYRAQCERDLARRRGLLSVRLMGATEAGEVVGLGKLSHEFGDLLQALAPALADGRISEADLPHARRIIDEADELVSAVLSVRVALAGLLPEGTATG